MKIWKSTLGKSLPRAGVAGVMLSAVLALLAGGTGQVLAANFYVGGAGASDRNPGTASQPFATIQKAATVAVAGDFINLGAGTEDKFHDSYYLTGRLGALDAEKEWFYRSSIKPDAPGNNDMTSGTDPRFANAGEGGLKYRLQANSPAIGRGAMIPGVTDGHVGSAPDLGAYEYGGPEWVAGCSINAKIR